VPFYVWIALGVFVVCLVAGTIWATVNALRAWRRGRPALDRMNVASARLSEKSLRVQRRLETIEPKTARLQHDVARVSRSVARARILFGSVKEVRTAYRVARFFT
jgi:hypothetical protein